MGNPVQYGSMSIPTAISKETDLPWFRWPSRPHELIEKICAVGCGVPHAFMELLRVDIVTTRGWRAGIEPKVFDRGRRCRRKHFLVVRGNSCP